MTDHGQIYIWGKRNIYMFDVLLRALCQVNMLKTCLRRTDLGKVALPVDYRNSFGERFGRNGRFRACVYHLYVRPTSSGSGRVAGQSRSLVDSATVPSSSTGAGFDVSDGDGSRVEKIGVHDHFDNSQNGIIDFGKAETIFMQKSSLDLARSFVVLQMCSFSFFVDNSLKLMNIGHRLLGRRLFASLMQATFYGQFAASPQSVKAVGKRFNDAGIAPMLATTAEEEVGDDPNRIDEEKYERNLVTMLTCLDMQREVARKDQATLTQLKMTSYLKGDVLAKLSKVLAELQYDFRTDNPVSVANFRSGLDGHLEPVGELTEVEMGHLRLGLGRLDIIMQRALKNDITILVDAEYVAINPAMSLITFALMKKYNSSEPRVWNTYQCYLKSAMRSVERGIEVADAEGFQFGVKLVRGAYMDHERREAKAQGLRDPVNETYEATNAVYDRIVARLMDMVHQRGSNKVNFIIASHNIHSVQKAVTRMKELDISPREGSVVFGQLMGMCDHVSYGLGQAGYLTYKSLPFGSIDDVIPNMSRRAAENKTVFHRLKQEKLMLRQEIFRRALPWK